MSKSTISLHSNHQETVQRMANNIHTFNLILLYREKLNIESLPEGVGGGGGATVVLASNLNTCGNLNLYSKRPQDPCHEMVKNITDTSL